MGKDKVAIHIHTKDSDGQLDNSEAIYRAVNEGANIIALCNHDMVTTIDDSLKALVPEGTKILTSGEFSADELSNFHILGYNIQAHKYLQQLYDYLASTNMERCDELIQNIARHNNIDISLARVQHFAKKTNIDKAIIKQYLVHYHHATDTRDAHNRLIGKLSGNYVKTVDYRAAFIVSAIKECGGSAFWAHPAMTKKEGKQISLPMIDKICGYLKTFGLDGIEVTNLRNDTSHTQQLLQIAQKYDLMVVEGADFHTLTDTMSFVPEHMDTTAFLERLQQNASSFSRESLIKFDREVVSPMVDKTKGCVIADKLSAPYGQELDLTTKI